MLYKVDFDPGVTLIQVWHASGAFKTVGYSRIGKPGGPSPFSAAHKNYTYAIVSAEHDVPFYAEAFGLPDERVIPTGIPRMDLFFDEKYKTETRDLVHEAVPMTVGKKVILFAPTFRGTGQATRTTTTTGSTSRASMRCAKRSTRSASSRCTPSCSSRCTSQRSTPIASSMRPTAARSTSSWSSPTW